MAEIVPNEELRSVLLRFYEVVAAGDVTAFKEMLSSSSQLLIVGSDPEEWLPGIAGVEVFAAQLSEMSISIEPGEIRAFSSGAVGWVADQCIMRFPDGFNPSTSLRR